MRTPRNSARPVMSERAAYLRDGTAIYERSFAIIRAEADLSRFSAEEADVAVRMIHACGAVEAAQHIVFGPTSRRGRARRANGRRADPLRRGNGGARHYARALAGAQRRDLHAQRSARARSRKEARHDALGRGARFVARSSRRRRRRHRQCADGVVPPARSASMPARRSRRRSSAFRSALSAPRNRRRRSPPIRAACRS